MYRIQSEQARDLDLAVYDDEVRISFQVDGHEHSYVFSRVEEIEEQEDTIEQAFISPSYYISDRPGDREFTWVVGPNKLGGLVVRKHHLTQGWSASLLSPEDFENEEYNFKPISKEQFINRTEYSRHA